MFRARKTSRSDRRTHSYVRETSSQRLGYWYLPEFHFRSESLCLSQKRKNVVTHARLFILWGFCSQT